MIETQIRQLLNEIDRVGSTRESFAAIYALLIREGLNGDVVDWPTVNGALLKRYKKSGLIYIKRLAWKLR